METSPFLCIDLEQNHFTLVPDKEKVLIGHKDF
jgi:hypothetical protein